MLKKSKLQAEGFGFVDRVVLLLDTSGMLEAHRKIICEGVCPLFDLSKSS